MSAVTRYLYPLYWRLLSGYLNKRQPAASSVTLVQKLIFILPTRYGWWFLGLLLLLYLLGTNYQNNLILLLCYLLLSLFLLSIVLCYQNLQGLCLECASPGEGFAAEPVAVNLLLSSDKGDNNGHLMLTLNFVGQPQPVMLPRIGHAVSLSINAPKRGKYALPRLHISSQYPFGLWRAFSYVALAQHYWVYPAPASQANNKADLAQTQPASHHLQPAGDTLAPYRQGDSLRHLVWKRLARAPSAPVVRQHTNSPERQPNWVIVTATSGEALERALRLACRELLTLDQSGASYGLKMPAHTITQASGPAQLQRCLQALALAGNTEY